MSELKLKSDVNTVDKTVSITVNETSTYLESTNIVGEITSNNNDKTKTTSIKLVVIIFFLFILLIGIFYRLYYISKQLILLNKLLVTNNLRGSVPTEPIYGDSETSEYVDELFYSVNIMYSRIIENQYITGNHNEYNVNDDSINYRLEKILYKVNSLIEYFFNNQMNVEEPYKDYNNY